MLSRVFCDFNSMTDDRECWSNLNFVIGVIAVGQRVVCGDSDAVAFATVEHINRTTGLVKLRVE